MLPDQVKYWISAKIASAIPKTTTNEASFWSRSRVSKKLAAISMQISKKNRTKAAERVASRSIDKLAIRPSPPRNPTLWITATASRPATGTATSGTAKLDVRVAIIFRTHINARSVTISSKTAIDQGSTAPKETVANTNATSKPVE